MGPVRTLLSLGATVMAVDLSRETIWQGLEEFAEATPGTLLIPTTDGVDGCDVLRGFGAVSRWILRNGEGTSPALTSHAPAKFSSRPSHSHDRHGRAFTMNATPTAPRTVCPGRRIVLGSFLYADGGIFARLSAAADAVIAAVCAERSDTALISLCSPTEVFSVPAEAHAEATRRYNTLSIHTPWERAVALLSGNRYLEKNEPLRVNGRLLQDCQVCARGGARRAVACGVCVRRWPWRQRQQSHWAAPLRLATQPAHRSGSLCACAPAPAPQVWQQGPNYAFAKLVQRWRNIVCRAEGHVVSSNVAPATLTVSVMHNPLIRAGMLGCRFFQIVPFEPETSNALMTALMLHDLQSSTSTAWPSTELGHPLDLFQENAVHGGVWRCAYKGNSYTEVSALLYGLGVAAPYAAGAAVVGAGLLAARRSRL